MGTAFNDGTLTNVDFDGALGYRNPEALAAIEAIGAATLARIKLSALDTDATLGGGSASDTKVASQKAVKTYVDGVATGTLADWKDAVEYGTTGNITLSGLGTGTGRDWSSSIPADSRVAVLKQTAGAENGIYLAKSGSWVRAADADGAGEIVQGTAFLITLGDTLDGTTWFCSTSGTITIGTTATTWVQTTAAAAVGPGTIGPTELATDAVTTVKIDDQAVTEAKLDPTLLLRVMQRADKMTVFVSGGTIYAINSAGTIVSSATASATNNPTVIQAAIDGAAGAYSADGYGGGGTVKFGDYQYLMADRVLVKWGVMIDAPGRTIRKGTAIATQSWAGVVFKATTSLPTRTINGTTKRPLFQLGSVASPAGAQEDDNPHSALLDKLCIDMTDATNGQGILIVDTHDVDVIMPMIAGPDSSSGGSEGACIEVISTVAPDEGALANRFHDPWLFRFRRGIYGHGTGSTDSEIYRPRMLQGQLKGIHWESGGLIVLGGHMTTGGTVDCDHIDVENGPTYIGGGIYLDTTGGYHVVHRNSFLEMNGFYIKCASGTPAAPIICNTSGGPAGSPGSANTSKVQILNGKMQCSATTKALVQLCRTTGNEFRATVMGNLIGTGGNSAFIATAINLAEAAIAETGLTAADFAAFKAAMAMDVTIPPAASNPLIAFNRLAISAL